MDRGRTGHGVARLRRAPDGKRVGRGQYVRLEEFDVAEVAVEVVHSWQRHGVGTARTEALPERAVEVSYSMFAGAA